MDPDIIKAILIGMPTPTVVSLVLLLVLWWPRANPRPRLRATLTGFVIATAMFLAYVVQSGVVPRLMGDGVEARLIPWPPEKTADWIAWVGLFVVVGAIAADRLMPLGVHVAAWGLRVPIAAMVALAVMSRAFARLSSMELLSIAAVMTLLIMACWWAIDHASRRAGGWSVPLVAWATASVGAIAIVVVGKSLITGQLSGMLATTMGAAVVVGLLRRNFSLAGSAAGVFAALMVSLLAMAHLYAELPATLVVILGLAPVAAALADVGPLARMGVRSRLLLRLAFAGVVFALAMVFIVPAAMEAAKNAG
jgi:hypothetical protein